MSRFGIYPASFVHVGGTLNLRQIRSQSLRRNGAFNSIRPGGSLDNKAHILSTANPTAGFATRDLGRVFGDANGGVSLTNGLYCSGGHTMRWQKRLEGGAFDPSAAHTIQTTPKGFLNPVQIEVDVDSQTGAECVLEYVALSAAGENPVTTLNGQAISGVTPEYNSVYYAGGVWLGAGQVTSMIRQRVVPGLTYSARRADGGVFPRANCSSINARDPSIQLDFLNVGMIGPTMADLFASALGASLSVYFQLGSIGNDGRVDPASLLHMKVTAAAGTWGADDIAVSGEEDAVVTVAVMPSDPLAISMVSAIP